jgi:hypothetical protein
MKTTSVLFTTMVCAALMHGTGYAAPSDPVPEQPPSEYRQKSIHPKIASGNLSGLHQNTSSNNRALSMRPPSVGPLPWPSFKNVRNHSSSPAIIGGSANSTRDTAAINGTGMNRKP